MSYDINTLQSAWLGHREFAEWLVREVQPKLTVELGVDYGFSLFCFANQGIGEVVGIDTFEGDEMTGVHGTAEAVVQSVIDQNKYTNITIQKSTFDECFETWDKEDPTKKIDILHIDGLHTYTAVKNDYDKWSTLLSDNGVILMHDTVSFNGVKRCFEESNLLKLNFPHSAGLGVLTRNKELFEKIKANFPNAQG